MGTELSRLLQVFHRQQLGRCAGGAEGTRRGRALSRGARRGCALSRGTRWGFSLSQGTARLSRAPGAGSRRGQPQPRVSPLPWMPWRCPGAALRRAARPRAAALPAPGWPRVPGPWLCEPARTDGRTDSAAGSAGRGQDVPGRICPCVASGARDEPRAWLPPRPGWGCGRSGRLAIVSQ